MPKCKCIAFQMLPYSCLFGQTESLLVLEQSQSRAVWHNLTSYILWQPSYIRLHECFKGFLPNLVLRLKQ